MSKYQWLLFLHVTGAFFLIGGSVIAATLMIAARRRQRPSEIALLLGLVLIGVVAIGVGVLMTLVFGLWLVSAAPYNYSYGSFWIVAAITLWVVSNALGWAGSGRDRRTRELAQRLAAEGDAPSDELNARLRDPVTMLAQYGSGLGILLLLIDMIWKPGA